MGAAAAAAYDRRRNDNKKCSPLRETGGSRPPPVHKRRHFSITASVGICFWPSIATTTTRAVAPSFSYDGIRPFAQSDAR